jgi:prepilin-type processing-associated H-X9-DG protein
VKIHGSVLFFILLSGVARADRAMEQTLADFVKLWNNRDFPAAATLVLNGNPRADFTPLRRSVPNASGLPTIRIQILTSRLLGKEGTGKETGRVDYRLLSPGSSTRQESVKLVRSDGRWKIVPAEITVGDRVPGPIVSVAASLMVSTKRIDTGVQGGRDSRPTGSQSLSNVKQLAVAAVILGHDHEKKFAIPRGKTRETLSSYVNNRDVWRLASDPKGFVAYSFNEALSNVRFVELREPSRTVLIYEGSNKQLNFRHEGRAAVGFADGSARLISRSDASGLRWTP